MRLMSFVTLSTALLLSTAAAAETKTPAEPAEASIEKVAVADKKICKRLKSTGTRMEDRVCLTKDDWKKVEEEVRQ